MGNYTPGHWDSEKLVSTGLFRSPEKGDFYIVGRDGICPAIIWGGISESESNACLIAAAPDLLEASEKTVDYIEQLCNMVNNYADDLGLGQKVKSEDFTEKLSSAIAKARGEN